MAYRELDVTFGKFIKDNRQILGITQKKISELIGMSTMHFAETYIKPEINEAGEFLGIKI